MTAFPPLPKGWRSHPTLEVRDFYRDLHLAQERIRKAEEAVGSRLRSWPRLSMDMPL